MRHGLERGTRLSERLVRTEPSATVRIADLATELRGRGVDVVDLSAGRAAEASPDFVNRAATEALLAGDTHQTPAQGTMAYRTACARKLLRDNGIEADPETEVMATFGCKNGLTLALMATVGPGDEVIIEDPGFVSYGATVRFCGAEPVAVPLRAAEGWRWRREELEAAVTERSRVIILCSPHNPTGTVHSDVDLEVIADVARRHDLLVISDEIYERTVWGGRTHRSIATLPGMRERTITLMGLTKAFSMGGWRIGFVYAPQDLVAGMVVIQAHLATCVGSFTQAGGRMAFATDPAEVSGLWEDWERRCTRMARELDRLPGVSCAAPEGGFYAWADVGAVGRPSLEVAEELLRDHHVAVVPGSAFGARGEGFIRVTSVKSDRDLDRALDQFARYFR